MNLIYSDTKLCLKAIFRKNFIKNETRRSIYFNRELF